MGTAAEVRLYATAAERADELLALVFGEIDRIEKELSSYLKTSEISRLNRLAASQAVTTDPETFELLERCVELSRASGGAFDITVGRLMNAWGFFRSAGRHPNTDELAAARLNTGWRHLALEPQSRRVRFLQPALEIDLGAIGKGVALDRAATLLREAGAPSALLGLGRSSYYALGAPPSSAGWPIEIHSPSVPKQVLTTVELRDQGLSTSGSAESFFELDGQRYSHIMDPRSGVPVRGMAQVTVLSAQAATSDALSTALFVLGAAAGAELLRSRHAAALLVTAADGEAPKVMTIDWPTTVADAR